ncbi:hypothetical protein ABZT49_20960 [Methylobacterium sp. EM32]|uniref:hypothetical protein n=1 Tax=Methylobacterium sp. EM32 TaxID=3163481 RepID=UPI0033A0D38A
MTDPDPTARPPAPPVPQEDDGAARRKDLLALLAALEPIDEEFPDFDAGLGKLREIDVPDDQDRGSEPGRR